MADNPRDPPRPPGGLPSESEGKSRLGRGGGRFEKKRRKRERRTGPEGGARLRSAREGMEDDPVEESPQALASRKFQADGVAWVAWEGGRAAAGPPSSPSATLLEIHFAPDSEVRRPSRSVLAVSSSLEDISHERLVVLWQKADPYRNPRDSGRPSARTPGDEAAG